MKTKRVKNKKVAKKKATNKRIAKTKVTKKPVAKKKVNKTKATKKPVAKKKVTKKKVTEAKVKKVTSKLNKKTVKKTVKKVSNNKNKTATPNIISFNEPEIIYVNNDRKFKISFIVNIILVIALIVLGVLFFKNINSNNTKKQEIIITIPEYLPKKYQDEWKDNHGKAYNEDDYVGQIIFESGIIDEPVLQSNDNETYLNKNFETFEYEICGPVFMDYICNRRNDQNTIVYGHTRSTAADPKHVIMFSPLHLLIDQNNYEDNKIIYFAYEDNVDVFLITNVYKVAVEAEEDGTQYLLDGEPLYYLNEYSDSEFEKYKKAIISRQYYDTGLDIYKNDELLTLQTCFEGNNDKLIVVAKKIGTKEYKN